MYYILFGALGICFFVYLLYSCQFKWLLGVVRNMALGVVGILGINALVAGFGVYVGVNFLTVAIVGLLGLPGFFLLYATSLLA